MEMLLCGSAQTGADDIYRRVRKRTKLDALLASPTPTWKLRLQIMICPGAD